MTQMGATRQLEAVRRTGYASSRGWLARVFWPKVSSCVAPMQHAQPARSRIVRARRCHLCRR
jgi:hypothetical protein